MLGNACVNVDNVDDALSRMRSSELNSNPNFSRASNMYSTPQITFDQRVRGERRFRDQGAGEF